MKKLIRHLIPQRFRPYHQVKHLVSEAGRGGIFSGPFQGMTYVDQAVCSAWHPKLLGTYEQELHPVVHEIIGLGFRTVIDIGAAEGYYACGLAKKLPQAKVLAFEADLKGRFLLERNIALNSLQDKVAVRGFCDPSLLAGELNQAGSPVLIICDTEGYEYDLLSPLNVPALKSSWVLVELHDFMLPGIGDIIEKRFAATHTIKKILAQPRTRQDFPVAKNTAVVKRLPFRYLDEYINEFRPPGMSWLWMKPLTKQND